MLANSQFDGIEGINSSQGIASRGKASEGIASKDIPRAMII